MSDGTLNARLRATTLERFIQDAESIEQLLELSMAARTYKAERELQGLPSQAFIDAALGTLAVAIASRHVAEQA